MTFDYSKEHKCALSSLAAILHMNHTDDSIERYVIYSRLGPKQTGSGRQPGRHQPQTYIFTFIP